MLEALYEQSCPSIRARIKTELLNQPTYLTKQEMLNDPLIQEVFSWSENGGWEKASFHGYNSVEAAIRILIEKGVDPKHTLIRNALQTMEGMEGFIYRGIGKPGEMLDEAGLGGSKTIQAYLFAKSGQTDHPIVITEIHKTLKTFESVSSWETFAHGTLSYKNKVVFRKNFALPSIYHLRLLAFTKHWRSQENLNTVTQAIKKLVAFSPMPETYLKIRSQLVAPASFAMLDFRFNPETISPYGWMQWFHRMGLLNRVGVIDSIPELKQQQDWLNNHIEENKGWFMVNFNHSSFKRWGAYSGLQLETNWRTPQRRMNDLSFRARLLLNTIY